MYGLVVEFARVTFGSWADDDRGMGGKLAEEVLALDVLNDGRCLGASASLDNLDKLDG